MAKATLIFGTVGAPMSTPKNPGGTVGGIRRLSELGLGALELAWVQSVRVSEGKCAEIKAVGVECGLGLSVHAPYYINLNATADEWPRSRKRLMDAAHYGNLAGATDIIFHPGSYFGGEPRVALELAVPRLRQCVADLRAAGNPAQLRPETMGKSAMLGSLEDTLVMAEEIEGVEPCIDFAHLHARPGDGTVNTYAEWQALLKLYKKRLGAAAPPQAQRVHRRQQAQQQRVAGARQRFADAAQPAASRTWVHAAQTASTDGAGWCVSATRALSCSRAALAA